MIEVSENLIQSVPTAAVAIVAIWALVEVIKSKRQTRNGSNDWNRKTFEELKLLNENHLHSIEKVINEGNEKIVRAINDGNQRVVELLGRILGRLDK